MSSPLPRPSCPHPARSRLLLLLALACGLLALLLPGSASANPIAPEQAFPLRAQALDERTVEVVFDISKGYYLYGDKFRFEAEPPAVVFEAPLKPAGKLHRDDFFGEVETHRGELRILLPLPADSARQFELFVTSQGCWDGGICYPPLTQSAQIDLDLGPQQGGGGFLDALRNGSFTTANVSGSEPPASLTDTAAELAVSGDASGDIARLLGDAGAALILLSFFGFGLLLAFTPCTFPMIPILSSIIVGQGEQSSHLRAFSLSLAYVLGMALTYALAGVAAGLSGTMLSAALQNVWVLSAFALIFVLLALSMFGFYELQLPTALQSRLAQRGSRGRGSLSGVALMGALSALIVGPCVAAPLAGALLYIAQTGDAVLGGFALFVMALGMGTPLLAVGMASHSLLPKVGPWMEGVKKAFGVLLLAVALWLLTPLLPLPILMLGWAVLLLFSAIFLRALDPLPAEASGWSRFWKACGVLLLLAGIAQLAGALGGARDPLQPLAFLGNGSPTGDISKQAQFERVRSLAELEARLAASERPVMLDFYADWCVSCKEMERFTFTDASVAARMNEMLLLKADVTANNADDKALLQRFELFGPPGIIFFDREGREVDGLRVVGYMKPAPFSSILDRALR